MTDALRRNAQGADAVQIRGQAYGARKKGLATRARLLDAAEACIADLGYAGTNSREVTERAGVTFGAIQYHFGTYERMLLAVVERAASRMREMLERADISGTSTRERVEALTGIVWSYYASPQYLSYIEIPLNLVKDPATSADVVESLNKIKREVGRLWHGLAVRLFGPTKDEVATQQLVFAVMRGLAISKWLNEGRIDYEEVRSVFVRMLSNDLDAPDTPD